MTYVPWHELMLCKFPAFDSRWTPGEMISWLDVWLRLYRLEDDAGAEHG